MSEDDPRPHEKKKRASYGISWLLAGVFFFLFGLATLGGGYALTFLSIPFAVTAIVQGATGIRVAGVVLVLLAALATYGLYEKEAEYWPPREVEQSEIKENGT